MNEYFVQKRKIMKYFYINFHNLYDQKIFVVEMGHFQFRDFMSNTWVVEDKGNSKSILINCFHLKILHTDNRGSQVSTNQNKSCQPLKYFASEEQNMGWSIQDETMRYGNW